MSRKLKSLVKEILRDLRESNTTSSVAPITTPKAFSKNKKIKNRGTQQSGKEGLKVVSRPKRPSNTKLVDYLNENTTGKI